MENCNLNPLGIKIPFEDVELFDTIDIVERYKIDKNINVGKYFREFRDIRLCRCKVTGLRFFLPRSIAGDGDFYSELGNHNSLYYHSRWEHNKALSLVNKDELWLEVGAGGGGFMKSVKDLGGSIVGLDLNVTEVFNLRERGFEIYNQTIEKHKIGERSVYDVICLFQVLEHLPYLDSFFINANRLLKENGKLVITVPNNNPYYNYFEKKQTLNLPPHHMNWWNKKSLRLAGKLFGFNVVFFEVEPFEFLRLKNLIKQDYTLFQDVYLKIQIVILKIINRLPFVKIRNVLFILYSKYCLKGNNILIIFNKKN